MKVSTPGEAKARRLSAMSIDRVGLIDKIERAIARDTGPYWFNIRHFQPEVVESVRAAYAAAGWRARIQHDPRDGDALVLETP